MTDSPMRATSEFRDGLKVDQLQPPHLVTFFGGLPRRLDARLHQLRSEDEAIADHVLDRIDHMTDRIGTLIAAVIDNGFSLDEEVAGLAEEDETGSSILPEQNRFDAACVETMRRLSGIPASSWEESGDLLTHARDVAADVAADLRQIVVQN